MKIIQVNMPSIDVNGKTIYMTTKMFRSFSQFDDFLLEQEKNYGVDVCYFFGAYNSQGINEDIIVDVSEYKPILFFRYALVPSSKILSENSEKSTPHLCSSADRFSLKY